MPKRSKDWNEGLAKALQDLDFARELLLASGLCGLDSGLEGPEIAPANRSKNTEIYSAPGERKVIRFAPGDFSSN